MEKIELEGFARKLMNDELEFDDGTPFYAKHVRYIDNFDNAVWCGVEFHYRTKFDFRDKHFDIYFYPDRDCFEMHLPNNEVVKEHLSNFSTCVNHYVNEIKY